MQCNISLVCGVVWLFLLCIAAVCPFVEKQPKRWHDRPKQIHQKTHSTKKFCDPSFSNQTAGAITQKCSSGFYREQTGHNRGQCVPCSCNNLSNECDEHTGDCVNCQFNTTGDRCERCKEGYYGNAANRMCHACPCPFAWNNFALACLDVGTGEVECLCKRGYSGVRCERCAHGYFGNPMVPGGSCKACNCKAGSLSVCDSLTGKCITSGNSSCGDHCTECDGCTYASLLDLEKLDDGLVWLKQQLKNISHASPSRLNKLEANTSETKILVGRYITAVRHLDPKVEQLEADVHVVTDDVSQLTDETHQTVSDVEKVLQNANRTQMKANDLFSEAETLLTATQDLMKQLSEVKPSGSVIFSEHDKIMEEAQRIVQEMRGRSCTAQRGDADSEQEEAHKLLDSIKNNTIISEKTDQAADSLRVADSPLKELAELLSESHDTVNRTKGLNLKSDTTLQQLQHLQTQLDKEQSMLLPVTEMTKDFLKNVTDVFLVLEETKKDFENHAAQLDGAKWELFKKLNMIIQIVAKVDMVTKAEEHAEELHRVAAKVQLLLNSTSSIDLLSALTKGAHNSLINALEKAEIAANESRAAADQDLKDVKEGGLVQWAKLLTDNLMQLQTEASETHINLKMLSHAVNTHKDHVNKQKEKRESLIMGISAIREDLRHIKRHDAEVLIEAAKTAASGSNSTVRDITERLRNISQEVERLSLANVIVNTDDLLIDAEQTLKNLKASLPVLKGKVTKVEALSRKVPPSTNMTESIRRIKDLIEETRNFVNRVSVATSFNGKNHVELRPPKNFEDIKAFTAVDLLLNRHQVNSPKADRRRRQRQDTHRDANLFVFYLGNKDTSGDYIGMAIRNNMLICVYKLGGVVHEVENGQITTTTYVNSSDFDRVVFHRVYQDAEVNVTKSFTSQKPVTFTNRNLPNTMTGVLDLHVDHVVFYVGGYPEAFMPPVELRYPRYRGAIKLSYINDNPVCLFNFKHAVNMDTRQPYIKIPQSEVSDYYDGTGYRMAYLKEPDKKQKRFFKFHMTSRETNALLFYIGNEESFFCVYVERGFLVLQGQQAGQELRAQSADKISLFEKLFAIRIANQFVVQYGAQQIFTANTQTNYTRYFIGGLPTELRQRHNITAPPLRGCVDHLTADSESVEYNRTIGVSDGCPVSVLGVRAATLHSALSDDSLFVWDELPVNVSLGFTTTDRHGAILRSSSQGSTSVHDFQLSLADGYVVLNSDNYTLKSDNKYNDGSWHYVSAVRRPTGLELSVDNVIQGQTLHVMPVDKKSEGKKFKGCIANLYARRPEQGFIPTDLSLLPQMGNVVPGLCSLHLPPGTKLLAAPVWINPKRYKSIQAPAGSQCRGRRAHSHEHHLYGEHSWLSYTLPQDDLNYRPHFSFDLKTKSSKGLIFHVAGRGLIPLLALYIANGKIKMSLGQNRIIHSKQRSNDDNWHKVEFSVEKSTFHLLVDGIRVTDGQLLNDDGSSLDLHNPVYLGSDLHSKTTKGHDVPVNSVIGCIRNFKMNEVAVEEPDRRHKTLPCFEWHTGVGTYFGGGHVVIDNYFTVGSNFMLAFELRPLHLTGLLFHVRSDKTSLNVFLMENTVGVKVNDGNGVVSVSVMPHQSLCDTKFHSVTVSKQGEVIKLVVDSMSEQQAGPSASASYSTTLHSLYIGGTTTNNRVPVSSPFVGCLRNVNINGRPVAFETESRVVEPVSINRCPTY